METAGEAAANLTRTTLKFGCTWRRMHQAYSVSCNNPLPHRLFPPSPSSPRNPVHHAATGVPCAPEGDIRRPCVRPSTSPSPKAETSPSPSSPKTPLLASKKEHPQTQRVFWLTTPDTPHPPTDSQAPVWSYQEQPRQR